MVLQRKSCGGADGAVTESKPDKQIYISFNRWTFEVQQ
jgi:hypothetical protein